MQTRRSRAFLQAACVLLALVPLAIDAQAGAFDPANGVLGLRWGASIDQVRQAFPDDRRSGNESTKLGYFGAVELGSLRLPKAGVFFTKACP